MVVIRGGDAVEELARAFDADLAHSDRASADVSAGDWLEAKAFPLLWRARGEAAGSRESGSGSG